MNTFNFSEDEQKEIVRLKNSGVSSRKICEILGWKTSRKSSVNFFYKAVTEANKQDSEQVEVLVEPITNTTNLQKSKANILFYDIETTLAQSYHWGQWKQNISAKQTIQESILLSHAWAWNDGEIKGHILTKEEVQAKDPTRLIEEAWALFDNADVIVCHNAKRFDIPKMNAMFLMNGFPPPSPYKVIDTLLIAKKNFKLPFNSLKYLAESLNVVQKIDNSGMDLWIRCDKGQQDALDEMLDYNIGDIDTLREVYRLLIGWDNQGINLSIYNDEHDSTCPHCGDDNISPLEGKLAYTPQRKYGVYRCGNCNATMRGRVPVGISNKFNRIVA